jgi:hypothetical protein
MKTENETDKTETKKPMQNEEMKNQTTAVEAITANTNPPATETKPSESADGTAKANTERLAELATKIRDAYAKEHEAGGMVVDWKAKQLKAGIEMGECLLEAKSLLEPFKGFVKWCRDNFSDLSQRTLNRYMKLARNKDETHVSQATGLRDAYEKCSGAESDGQSDVQKDWAKIRRHLSKAKDMLNGFTDLASCEEADTVCELVDALNTWVAGYRGADRLNTLKDVNCDIPLNDAKQPTTPEENAEYATAE